MIMDNRLLVARRKYDPDATRYINAVQLADGQALEPEVAMAIDAFVRGCKTDGTWSAIKASCILCGARTIAGALVPLAGTAPTAYNFTSANYNRETGLVGVPASNTWIDTNRANNADPQDDKHLAVYASQLPTTGLIYAGSAGTNPTVITASSPSSSYVYGRVNCVVNIAQASPQVGFFATARASASTQELRANGATTLNLTTSGSPAAVGVGIYGRYNADALTSDARIAFYSIGTAISDLSLLDARVSTLVSQIAAAIP